MWYNITPTHTIYRAHLKEMISASQKQIRENINDSRPVLLSWKTSGILPA